MKAGSLYYHFQSKDQILDRVLERGVAEGIRAFQAALAKLPADAPFVDRLEAVVVAQLQTVIDYGTFTVASRQLFNQVPDALRERHLAMREAFDNLWRDLLAEGKAKGDLRPDLEYGPVRLFLVGALNWSSEWMDPQRKSVAELGKIATDLLVNGMARPNDKPLRAAVRQGRRHVAAAGEVVGAGGGGSAERSGGGPRRS